jgi:outer membrane lipoprotein-sorting protein
MLRLRRPSTLAFAVPLFALVCAAGLFEASPAAGLERTTTDARSIAAAVEKRDNGDRRTSSMTLSVKDPSGRTRVRQTRVQSLDFAGGKKTLILFESPADVRNTGLLSVDYDDGNKDDDQWLYLPSLHRSTRISTSDKSGSFMGTDITYADMTERDSDLYDYTLVSPSVMVGKEDCWLIEAVPRSAKERKETGYLKTQSWISKDKLMPLQIKAWVEQGKKVKYMKFDEVQQIDGIWVSNKLVVRTMRGSEMESETTLQFSAVKFNQASVTDQIFTERRLEQGL